MQRKLLHIHIGSCGHGWFTLAGLICHRGVSLELCDLDLCIKSNVVITGKESPVYSCEQCASPVR